MDPEKLTINGKKVLDITAEVKGNGSPPNLGKINGIDFGLLLLDFVGKKVKITLEVIKEL